MIAAALASRYRSLFVIGRGGMGSVEAALEVGDDTAETYQRVVALKRLLPDAARDKRRAEMFLREARLAKLLDHPNVVRAFDYGEIDGELFLAMEYVEGQPLSRVLRTLAEAGEELPVAVACYVLAEVCEGLHAAHELRDAEGRALNLVHRDVSPQNVMLGYDGHVRLLDFGVAKIETENVTKTGEVKGKTAYMSPEQAMGETLDRRSDLFGVGAMLFECLALRRMWGAGTDMEIIRKLALEEPPPLEDAAKDAPEPLRALYTRLVARDAKDRPATAHDVATALIALVPGGKDAAARELSALLDRHFATYAAEQRKRLSTSLDEVAPEQAAELRASAVPTLAPPPSVPAVATVNAEPSPRPRRSPLPWIVGAAALAGVALVALRREPVPPPKAVVAATPTATAAPVPTPVTSAPAPPPETATASAPSVTAAPKPPPAIKPVVKPPPPPPPPPPKAPASVKPPDVIPNPF